MARDVRGFFEVRLLKSRFTCINSYKKLHGAVNSYKFTALFWSFFFAFRVMSFDAPPFSRRAVWAGVDSGMVGVQRFFLAFKTYIDIPGRDRYKVHRYAQRFASRVKAADELVIYYCKAIYLLSLYNILN